MYRPSSPLTRILRGLTALATVWCLGCSAFEPILAALHGGSAGSWMDCASDGSPERAASARQAGEGGYTLAVSNSAVDADPSTQDFACQCQGCHAPSPTATEVAADRPAMPTVPSNSPATLLSVVREPLVPPPQRALRA